MNPPPDEATSKAALELRRSVIEHLTKEIEAQTTAMVTWRSRVNFTAYFGPWIVVGAYLSFSNTTIRWPAESSMAVLAILAAAAFVAVYGMIGYFAGLVEEHVWEQCDRWREVIARLQDPDATPATAKELQFPHSVTRVYLWVYALMLAGFASATTVLVVLTC